MYSCTQQTVEKPVFTSIDLSWGNGWTKIISVYIDSSKAARITVDELGKKRTFFKGQLTDTAFICINHLLKRAMVSEIAKEIGSPIPDGGCSCIIVDSKIKNFATILFQSGIATELDSIVNTLVQLDNYRLNKSADSTFIFKSYIAIKPPLMETTRFVPPVIKEDTIEK